MDATATLACPHEFLVGIPNPFVVEHAIALLSLVLVYAIWRRVKPAPVPGLRGLMVAAAGSTIGVMLGLAVGAYDLASVNVSLVDGVSAAVVVTAALLVELLLPRTYADCTRGGAMPSRESSPSVRMSSEHRRFDVVAARMLHVAAATGLAAVFAPLSGASVLGLSATTAIVGIGHMLFDMIRTAARC